MKFTVKTRVKKIQHVDVERVVEAHDEDEAVRIARRKDFALDGSVENVYVLDVTPEESEAA